MRIGPVVIFLFEAANVGTRRTISCEEKKKGLGADVEWVGERKMQTGSSQVVYAYMYRDMEQASVELVCGRTFNLRGVVLGWCPLALQKIRT